MKNPRMSSLIPFTGNWYGVPGIPELSASAVDPDTGAWYDRFMRVISKRMLREFWTKHPDAEQPLRAWYDGAKKAHWTEPIDLTRQYRTARTIGNGRAIFRIKGNSYRLIVAIRYDKGLVFIRFVGTHAQYDGIDAQTV